MKKNHAYKNIKGFTLVESVITLGVLSVAFSVIVTSLASFRLAPTAYDTSSSALRIASEGIFAARSLRDVDFSNLTDGMHGIVRTGSVWKFSGTSDTVSGFTRSITVASVLGGGKSVDSIVFWTSQGKSKTLSLKTELYNWRQTSNQAASFVVNTSGFSTASATVSGITVTNTSTTSSTTIRSMRVSFSNTPRRLLRIRYTTPNNVVWSSTGPGTPTGTQSSGVLIDIQDYVIAPSTTKNMLLIFNGSIAPSTFSVEYTFGDGSIKTVSF